MSLKSKITTHLQDLVGAKAFGEYQQTGRREVLDVAVSAFTDAVAATPPGHPDLAGRLSNLGASLAMRFERAGDAGDLDAAIDAVGRAADLTPPGHPDLAMYLSNLGNSLQLRFERAGDPGDLDAAIDAGRPCISPRPATRTWPCTCRTSGAPSASGSSWPATPATSTPRSTPAGRASHPARRPEPGHVPVEPRGLPAQAIRTDRGPRGSRRRDRRGPTGCASRRARPPETRPVFVEPG